MDRTVGMDQQGAEYNQKPVFLYGDPYPAHEKVAPYVDAEMVKCETEIPTARFHVGRQHYLGNHPIILESLCGGLQRLTAHDVRTTTKIRTVDRCLISDATALAMARRLDWNSRSRWTSPRRSAGEPPTAGSNSTKQQELGGSHSILRTSPTARDMTG